MKTAFSLLQGTLTVEAAGYWYTSGGEKGSFGYYPHLKDDKGHPVYPDTQLHGDLRMAAAWVGQLGAGQATPERIDQLFGKQGNESAALLHVGDLQLSETSRKEWTENRFDIKPRIEIDDERRSVKPGMLANFEAAWLDELTLEAPLYIGYFTDEGEAAQARQLLDESVHLLSGFGALRSRGYGRGKVRIDWQPPRTVTIAPATVKGNSFTYALESLVNLRSKPVAAEQLQLVATNRHLTAEQLRGWFVKIFHQAVDRWPDAGEMASIVFNDLFPSPSPQEPAFPPANTTLRREDGAGVDDYWGKAPDDERGESLTQNTQGVVGEKEGKAKCKLKPLKPGTFITAAGEIHPSKSGVRMRNAMQEDFRTLDEGGLFVQQYLPRGTVFCGRIALADPASEFARLAHAILTGLWPVINGSILQPTVGQAQIPATSDCSARLVTQPILFDPARVIAADEGITIGTVRRYAPALRRPRRNRSAILPGSVLTSETEGTVAWPLFGKNISTAPPKAAEAPPKKPEYPKPLPELGIDWEKVTRSQAGILRELLNRDHNPEVIGKYLQDLRDKHNDKSSGSDLAKLYLHLEKVHKDKGISALREQVGKILDHLKAEVWWESDKKGKSSGGQAQ